jgi:hypothetical protein
MQCQVERKNNAVARCFGLILRVVSWRIKGRVFPLFFFISSFLLSLFSPSFASLNSPLLIRYDRGA